MTGLIYGDAEGISPEVPIPVLRVLHTRAILAQRRVTATNVASLRARVVLLGLVGEDEAGAVVRQLVTSRVLKNAEFQRALVPR